MTLKLFKSLNEGTLSLACKYACVEVSTGVRKEKSVCELFRRWLEILFEPIQHSEDTPKRTPEETRS